MYLTNTGGYRPPTHQSRLGRDPELPELQILNSTRLLWASVFPKSEPFSIYSQVSLYSRNLFAVVLIIPYVYRIFRIPGSPIVLDPPTSFHVHDSLSFERNNIRSF